MEYLSPKDGGLPFKQGINSYTTLSLLLLLTNTIVFAAPIPVVRVMVEREKKGVQINGFDLLVSDASLNKPILHENRKASIEIKCSLGAQMSVSAHSSESRSKNISNLSGPLHITSFGGFIRVGESQYRDDLYVYSFNGDCIVVNHVDLEKYVAGVLNSEMNAKWGLDTLKAQAIAARTYAIYQMRDGATTKYKGLRAPFDVQGNVNDQVYEGAHQERYKALKAVQETRGQVLTYNQKPIKAFYHSTCGGQTETPDRVWGTRLPYFRAVRCDFCGKSPRFNWVHSLPVEQLEQKLHREKLLWGKLLSIRVFNRNNIGRADKVEVRSDKGSQLISATRIRELAGAASIMSTDFTVVQNSGKLIFVGHGSGHGVGMCQWGAKFMGDKGYSSNQILSYYYPKAQVSKLY